MRSTPIEDILHRRDDDHESSHSEDGDDVDVDEVSVKKPTRRVAKRRRVESYSDRDEHERQSRPRNDDALQYLWCVVKSREFMQAVVLSSLISGAVNSQFFKQAVMTRVPAAVAEFSIAEFAICAVLTGLLVTLARPPECGRR